MQKEEIDEVRAAAAATLIEGALGKARAVPAIAIDDIGLILANADKLNEIAEELRAGLSIAKGVKRETLEPVTPKELPPEAEEVDERPFIFCL